MVLRKSMRLLAGGCAMLTASVIAAGAAGPEGPPEAGPDRHVRVEIAGAAAPVGMLTVDGRMLRLYGPAFSRGATPIESADRFLELNADFLGVAPDDLRDRDVRGVSYERDTGTYKFTRVAYRQYLGDVPVFRGQIKLLVRNDAGFPLVLAATDLREVREGDVEMAPVGDQGVRVAEKMMPGLAFTDPELVVWAGVDDMLVEPVLATVFIGESDDVNDPAYAKWLFVTDARTGEILYTEDQVHHVDVEGSVSGVATQGHGADICEEEAPELLPYARVNIGGTIAFADENGDFVIPNGGADPVTVESPVRGRYFRVFNQGGADSVLSMEVTPPGPADFLHNEPNDNDFPRAEVNGYLHANVCRDFILSYNPDYPTISVQTEFTVNVNVAGSCNAFYNGGAINFFRAGGGCPNMAYSSIVYHEYGHHLVATGGSGQGAYGEGMSDTLSNLIQDIPETGIGFFGNCNNPLRTADNDVQYPCNGPIHSCGRLLSGSVWDTRNQLLATNPDTYRDIISNLGVNAVLLHVGSSITPAITVDYLTLDDDDDDITNGTPHYQEIAAGFGAHNMDAPPLEFIDFEYPDGLPALINPNGTTTARVNVIADQEQPVPGTGILHFDDGNGIVQIPLEELDANQYEIQFPSVDCPTQVTYYITAEAENGFVQHSPPGAPNDRFAAWAANGADFTFEDDFETDRGWTVENDPNVTAGAWERGVPAGGDSGPDEDADGSGQCYVTGLAQGEDLDGGGFTVLTSPVMDASSPDAVLIFDLFMDNGPGTDGLIINVSDDGGDRFNTLMVYRPLDDGVWVHNEWRIDELSGVDNTSEFVIQFKVADQGSDHTLELAVDGMKMRSGFVCEESCDGDADGDNDVDFDDILAVLAAFGDPCDDCPEDQDGDDDVDFDDLLIVLANFGEAC